MGLWLRGCGRGLLESYRVAKVLELGDEMPGAPGGVLATDEVVVAEILEDLAGAEEVPDELDQRVRDGDGRFVGAAPASDLTYWAPK